MDWYRKSKELSRHTVCVFVYALRSQFSCCATIYPYNRMLDALRSVNFVAMVSTVYTVQWVGIDTGVCTFVCVHAVAWLFWTLAFVWYRRLLASTNAHAHTPVNCSLPVFPMVQLIPKNGKCTSWKWKVKFFYRICIASSDYNPTKMFVYLSKKVKLTDHFDWKITIRSHAITHHFGEKLNFWKTPNRSPFRIIHGSIVLLGTRARDILRLAATKVYWRCLS